MMGVNVRCSQSRQSRGTVGEQSLYRRLPRQAPLSNALITFGATWLIYLLLLAVVGFFLRQPRAAQREIVATALILFPLALLLATIAGGLYSDPRPFVVGHFTPLLPHAPDNGFPSDHALLASAVAMAVTLRSRWVGAAFWVGAILVGAARVAAGVHHPVDIVGSIVIAVVAGVIAQRATRRFRT